MPDYPLWVPDEITAGYIEHGIQTLLPWQLNALNNRALRAPKYANFVFSAPTSSGKTVVAELIAVNTVLELQCKALFVFPYVSVAKEKFVTLQKIWRRIDRRVSAFMGAHSSPSPQAWDAAVCTIEKANSLLNRMIDEKSVSEIGVLVIDEFHILFDGNRGPLIEQIVAKALYICHFLKHRIQIIALSATLPDLDELTHWLDAERYETHFRPVQLHELIMCDTQLYDANTLKFVRKLPGFTAPSGIEQIVQLCVESVVNGESVLVFCSSKAETEKIALALSRYFEHYFTENNADAKFTSCLNVQSLETFAETFRNTLQFVDDILLRTIPYGIAFHHAGLTVEEREAVEGAFREQSLRIVCATSTLSSGVNLPAHRVIIKAQTSGPVALNGLTYMQMTGRAGRLGQTTKGESIVVCPKNRLDSIRQLIQQNAIFAGRYTVKRRRIKLIIEAICSGLCSDENDLENLLALLFFGCEVPLHKELSFLITKKLISYQKGSSNGELRGTQLGRAVFASSLPADIALQVYDDLEKAMRSLALDTELHLLYLVTPLNNDSIWMNYIDWNVYYKIWSKLPIVLQRVGKMVGVQDSFIIGKIQGKQATEISDTQVHLRFLSALALLDLIHERPLDAVARRFHINRGALQTLQQQSATYAHMVVTFCERLGWTYLRSVLSGFSERLAFGVRKDITELVQIEGIDGARARAFHSANVTTIATLAVTSVDDITKILRTAVPFVRRQNSEGLNRWLAGEGLMSDIQAAQQLIQRARLHLSSSLRELGIFSDSKIDSLFSVALTSVSEWKHMDDNSVSSIVDECTSSAGDALENAAPELASNFFMHETFPLARRVTASYSERGATASKQNEEVRKGLPISEIPEFVVKRPPKMESPKTDELDQSNQQQQQAATLQHNPVTSKDNPVVSDTKSDSDDIELLCLNLSHTSMSDETLLRLGCSQQQNSKNEIEHITQALDTAAILVDSEKMSTKLQEMKEEKEEEPHNSELFKSLENLALSCEEDFQTATVATTTDKASGIPDINATNGLQKSEDPEPEKPSENRLFGRTASSLGDLLSLSHLSTLGNTEEVEDDKENENLAGSDNENPGNRSRISIASNDLFDRTANSSISSQSLGGGTPRNLLSLDDIPRNSRSPSGTLQNSSSYHCLDRIRRRSVLSNCSPVISPSFRSPAHKMLKLCSPILIPLKQETTNLGVNSMGDSKPFQSGTTEFQVVDVCKSRIAWDQFLARSKCWIQIGLGIATCNRDTVVGVALYALNEKCIYIDFRPKCVAPVGISERVAALDTILKSKQQKYIYDLMTAIRLLRKLPESSDYFSSWQLKNCICLQTLAYLAHYRTADDEFALSFQDLLSHLTSPQRAAVLRNATTRIRAAIGAFVCVHMYDDLISGAVRLSTAESVELELKSTVLFGQIEAVGMPFDVGKAEAVVARIKQQLTKIEHKAHQIAGVPFNFGSAAEISQVLFVRLQIPPLNQSTGRHYSTNKTVLKQLASNYPIAALILEWRRMNTALTTSLPTLLKACYSSHDGRIRANFTAQCCTGRILTVHPNVQNVQKDAIIDGYSVRSLFVAPRDKVLLSADYRQLEMRVLAHLSADPKLISMFWVENGDFFQAVTDTWNANKSLHSKVDRNKVKQLCYGIVYGMGAVSLAKQLRVQKQQAQQMILSFFQQFPKVRAWMDKILETCRVDGSVSTLLGRRRFLPQINSMLQAESAQAERQAINTCIQGSATELFKMSLLKVQKNLLGKNSSIIMQLHDEVLVETDERSIASVAEIVKHCMSTVMPNFRVPLAVKISIGKNWGDLREYA